MLTTTTGSVFIIYYAREYYYVESISDNHKTIVLEVS